MAGYKAGSTYVTVAPSFNGLQAAISAAMSDAGDRGGQDFASRWEQSASSHLQSALDNLPDVKIDADSTEAERAIADIRAEMETLGSATIGVDIDEGEARARLDALMVAVSELDGDTVKIDANADTAAALAQLQGLALSVRELDGKPVKIPSDTDTTPARSQLDQLRGALESITPAGAGMSAAIIAGVTAIIPVAAAAAAAIAGIAQAAAGIGAGLGVIALGLAPVIKAASALDAAQSKSSGGGGSGASEAARAQRIEDANRRIVDSERGVSEAREAAAQSAQDAAARVDDARRGVSDAVESAAQANTDAAAKVEEATRRVADAHAQAAERVRAAQEAQTRAVDAAQRADEQAARRTATAVQGVQRAHETASRAIASALSQRQTAERALETAQAGALAAQERLTSARRDAREAMQALNDAIREGSLNEREQELAVKTTEEKLKTLGPTALEVAQAQNALADAQRNAATDQSASAALAVQSARERLDALRASIGGTADEREAAQIAHDRAVLNLEETKRKNTELAAQKAESDRAGVDGSEKVRAAVEGVATANQRVADAQTGITEAAQRVRDAQTQGVRTIADAEQALADARERQAQTHLDGQARIADAARTVAQAQTEGARQISDAERALADARTKQAQTARDGARSVEDAQRSLMRAETERSRNAEEGARRVEAAERRVADARREAARAQAAPASGGGGAAANTAQKDLEKLAPAGRSFVVLLQEMKKGVEELSRTAQATMLPGFERALRSLAPAFGPINNLVGALGRTLGKLAEDGAAQLRGPFWTGLGKTLAEQLPVWLDKGARIIGNFATALAGAFKGMIPAGNDFLKMLEDWSAKLASNGQKLDSDNGFKSFLAYVRENLPRVAKTMGDLVDAIGNIVKALAPYGPTILDMADKLAKLIAAVPPDTLGQIITGFGAFGGTLKGLGAAASVAAKVRDVGQALTGFKTLGDVTKDAKLAGSQLGAFGKAANELRGKVTASTMSGVGKAFTGLRDSVAKIGPAITDAGKGLAKVKEWGPLVSGMEKLKGAFDMGAIASKFSGAISAVGGALKTFGMALLTPPLGVVVGIAALGVALVVAYQKSETFRNFVNGIGAKLKEAGKAVVDFAVAFKDKLVDGFNNVKNWVRDNWQNVLTTMILGPFGKLLLDQIRTHWDSIKATVTEKVNAVKKWFTDNWVNILVGLLTGPFGLLVKRFAENWDSIKRTVTEKATAVATTIRDKVTGWVNTIRDKMAEIVKHISDKVGEWAGYIRRGAEVVAKAITDAVGWWGRTISGWNVGKIFSDAWNGAVKAVEAVRDRIKPIIDTLGGWIKNITDAINRIPTPSLPSMPSISMPWASGGLIPGFSTGGPVPGQAPRDGRDNLATRIVSGTRSVAASLMSGEFVQPVASVRYYGANIMEALRRQLIPREAFAFAAGGAVPYVGGPAFAAGGVVGGARWSASSAASLGASRAVMGATTAVLDPSALAALSEIAGRPIVVQVNGRAILGELDQAARRYATR